ncbi:hypothetical protein Cgig2_027161 [Carnegiea gigantea]|uniref:Glycolipid transfer protein domain-containing protein n=1 Tax=Carnegiea gigantea TaxID=171969 RepID=A0A9Q1QPA8_9CARY|nr:hypothetical protein Cgig2_027161 [Carnegiea gigantea]
MEENIFTRALEAVKHIRSEEGAILTEPFLDLCKHLLPLVDKFGPSLSCIKADIASYIEKLESKYSTEPSRYSNLYTITKEEIEDKSARISSSCTNAFVWLNRWWLFYFLLSLLHVRSVAMDFLVQLFCSLLENPEWSMTQACTDSYKKTLKKWHGWMATSTSKVVMKLAPERKKFMNSIGVNDEVGLEIKKFCATFSPILEENHKFLADAGVDDLKAP